MSVSGLYFSLFLVFAWRDSLSLVASSVGGVFACLYRFILGGVVVSVDRRLNTY